MPKQFEAVPRRCITHSHEVAQHQSSGGVGGGGERWRGVQHRTEETQFIKPRPRWPTVGTRLSAGGLGGASGARLASLIIMTPLTNLRFWLSELCSLKFKS